MIAAAAMAAASPEVQALASTVPASWDLILRSAANLIDGPAAWRFRHAADELDAFIRDLRLQRSNRLSRQTLARQIDRICAPPLDQHRAAAGG